MVPERRSFPKKLELPETSSVQSQAPEVGVVNTVAKLVPESPVESRGVDFSSPMAFVSSLLPYARKYAQQLNLDPKVLLAQAALETGWGKFVMRTADGISSNNLFGIKAGNDWQGPSARIQSLEYDNGQLKQIKSAFRAYDNHQQSFKDYVEFIQQGPRYQKAVQSADSSKSYLNELQAAGYATDPDYAQKIHSIYQSDTLNSAVEQVEAQFMTR
jgi:flagellar protein FlgJ